MTSLISNKRHRSNDRLVRLVSEEKALEMLTRRKENKDIVAAGPVWVNRFVGHAVKEKVPEPEVNYAQFEPEQHICKAFHNS